MAIILNGSSQKNGPAPTVRSSCSTEESEMRLEADKRSCLPTTTASPHYMQPPCKTTELNTSRVATLGEDGLRDRKLRFAASLTAQVDAVSLMQGVGTGMPACPVGRTDMGGKCVESESWADKLGLRLRYLRHNLWPAEVGLELKMVAAEWTESAKPLPRPPPCEYTNLPVQRTLKERPDLFRIVTPIRVEMLGRLLKTHPNQEFVSSVLEGLQDGFWPWATTVREGYPITHDNTKPLTLSAEKESFLAGQLAHEQSLERVSGEVGESLLPGMYCMPSYVILKPH